MAFYSCRPTVWFRDDFNGQPRAEELKNAMDGFGTNEAVILHILGNHCCQQRLEIAEAYKVSYGQDLIEDLKGELGGHFETLCVALLIPPRLYDARELHEAICGAGTDESVLVQILTMRTNDEIQQIKEVYKEEYDTELEEDLQSDTSGHFRRLMVSLCVGGRESDDWWDVVDDDMEAKALQDAQALQEAGTAAWGTDEQEINAILCRRSPGHLRRVTEKYEELTGQSLEDAIKSECSGALQEGYLAIVEGVKSKPKYFARRLNDCFAGLGTADEDLIRIIVWRAEIDLEDVKDMYQQMYDKTLEEALEDECSGDYKRLLLELVHAQD